MSNSTYDNPRRGFGFIRLILIVLLLAVVGFGAWLGLSAKKVGDLFSQASTAYGQIESSIEAEDYSSALVYARTAASLTSQASTELKGTQWEIASKIPILGEDANIMRSLGDISGNLADGAVLPVLDSWDVLAQEGVVTNGTIDTTMIPEKVNQVVDLANTLQSASAVVDECSTQVNSLPTSHFDALNGWTEQLKSTVASVDATLDQLAGVASLVSGTASLFNSLTNI